MTGFRFTAALLATSSLAIAGCSTTQLSTYADPALSPGNAAPGVAYALPMLQYKIDATFTLTDCEPDSTNVLPVNVDVTAVQQIIDGEVRVINYEELSSATKTSSFDIAFYDGTMQIKSINAAVTDHVPEIAADILKGVVSLAKLATGVGGGGPEAAAPKIAWVCKPEIREIIGAAKKARARIDAIPAEATMIADQLSVLKTKATLGDLSPADRDHAAKLIDRSDILAAQLATLTAQAAEWEKRLSFSVESLYPKAPSQPTQAELLPFPPGRVAKWTDDLFVSVAGTQGYQLPNLILAASLLPVTAAPAAVVGSQNSPSPKMAMSKNIGVLYQSPAPGLFKVCAGDAAACAADTKPVFSARIQVPQFGQQRTLPLHNGWGQDNALSATFSTTGMLTSFKYEQKAAPAQKASAIFATAAGDALDIGTAISAKKTAAATADSAAKAAAVTAETDALQHKIDMLTKAGELAKLQAAQNDPGAAANSAALSTLTAQVALLKLEKEKKELTDAIGKQP